MDTTTDEDWQTFLGNLVLLQGQPVAVTITERGRRLAELRGVLKGTTGFAAEPDGLLLWVSGSTLPVAAFVVTREQLSAWEWVEDDGRSELLMWHGLSRIAIDFRERVALG